MNTTNIVLTDSRSGLASGKYDSIEAVIASFISSQDVRESSRVLYARVLRLFFSYVIRMSWQLSTITRAEVLRYKEDMLSQGLSPLTVGSYLVTVRKFYEWAESEKLYPNVAKGIKTPRRQQVFMKQHLTASKSVELMEHFSSNLRDEAIVNLLLRTGLRTIEVVRADVGDITFMGGRRVLKVWGKGRDTKDSFVILTDKCYQPIKAYLEARRGVKGNEPLFISESLQNRGERLTTRTIRGIVKEGLRSIGLDGKEYTAHSLRHTAAVAILKAGGTLEDAQHVLRHSNPATTEIYTRSIEQEMRIERAPEALIDNLF